MEILKAREMGFCFGVRRAINIMERAAQERGPIESLGAIVHNRQVVDMLAQRGITVIDELEDSSCNIVAITSHGVGPEVPETARNMGLTVIDTTCPFVRKAQAAGKKLVGEGFRVVIFGEAEPAMPALPLQTGRPFYLEAGSPAGWASSRRPPRAPLPSAPS